MSEDTKVDIIYKTEKELRGTPSDPNGSIYVSVYNMRRKKFRKQSFKRKNLMNKKILYTSETDGSRQGGIIIGFWGESGNAVIKIMDEAHPVAAETDFFVIEE